MPQSSFFPDCFYRVSAKGLYVRDGKVLLVRESKKFGNRWEMPGGGLDFGEDIKEGLKREIREETGLEVTKVSDKPLYIWTHKYDSNIRNIGWYYSLVLAYRIELRDTEFTPSTECEAIDFFSEEQLVHMKNSELQGQANELADYFKLEDFKEEF